MKKLIAMVGLVAALSVPAGAQVQVIPAPIVGLDNLAPEVFDWIQNAVGDSLGTLGTIAAQDADAVNLDGGTIDGTTIGATTPAAGTFTTLTATGTGTFDGTITAPSFTVTTAPARLIASNLFSLAFEDSTGAFSIRAVGADTSMTASLDRQYWDFVHAATPTTHKTGVSTVIYPEPANPDSVKFRLYATAIGDTVQARVLLKSGATFTFNSDWQSASTINTWQEFAFVGPVMTANTPYEVRIEVRIAGNKRACISGVTLQ